MGRKRTVLIGGLAASTAAVLICDTAVIAASKPHAGVRSTRVDEQTIVWRTGKDNRAFTTSTKWQELPMPAGGCVVGKNYCVSSSFSTPIINAKGPISLTFSGMFSRAPVELRFRDGDHLMRPGAVNFRPQPGSNAFSFTFVSPRKGERLCEGPALEWRSPTGQEVRLNKATIVVRYKKFEPQQPVGCV